MSKFIDKPQIAAVVKSLEAIGIKEKEALVYIALLDKNQVGSSKIVKATGLHGQFVYNSLSSLEEKGLVKHSIVKGRKKFSANSPSRIKSLLEQKKILAEQVIEKLNSLTIHGHEQDFEIYQGESACINHDFDLLENSNDKDYFDIIAGNSVVYYQKVLGPERTKEFEKILKRKNISFRIIVPEEQRDAMKEEAKKFINFDYRIMPKMKIGLVNTSVRPQNVTFHTYGEPLLSYTVRNEAVAKTYKQFFDSLWDMCGK